MQQDSGGNIPIHNNIKSHIHNFDYMKSTKTRLNRIIRPEQDINNDFLKNHLKNIFLNNKNVNTEPLNFKKTLNAAIYNTHNIVLQTCNFICAFVLYEYDKNKKNTIITDAYVKLIMKIVSKRRTKSGRKNNSTGLKKCFVDFYNKYYSQTVTDKNIAYDDKLSHILHYEALEIVKHIETNIKEHYIQYIYRYINICFDLKQKQYELNKIKNKEEKNEKYRNMYDTLNKIKKDLLQNQPNLKKLIFESPKIYHEWIMNTKKYIMPNKNFAKDSIHYDVTCNPQEYLQYMIWINKKINNMSTDEYEFKLFHVIPLKSSFIPSHITIDTSCLIDIFVENEKGKFFQNVTKNKSEIWNRYFKINSREFKKKGYEFNYMIKTDGVSCSINFVKVGNKDRNGKTKKLTRNEEKVMEQEIEKINNKYIEDQNVKKVCKNKKIIAIDPNFGNLIYGLDELGNVFRYTRNQRRKETKTKKYAQITKKINDDKQLKIKCNEIVKTTTISELQNVLSNYNSKICDLNKFLEYVKVRNMIEILVRDHCQQKIFRKFKMNRYTNTQKSESKMVKNFKNVFGSPETVVVVYGDYDNKGNKIKGKEPIVTKRLRKALKMMLVFRLLT